MATVLDTSAPYCGPEYAGQNCAYYAQLTPGLTGNVQSIPNTICAFQKDGKQYACDPGCCGPPPAPAPEPPVVPATDVSEEGFPLWAIILIIVLGFLGIICLIRFNGRLHDSI